MPSLRQRRSATRLLPVEAVGPNGALTRSDGTVVRYLELTPGNPLALDAADCERMTRGFTELIARIPDGQSLQLYAHAAPVVLDEVTAQLRAESDAANAGLPTERRQALQKLAACHEERLAPAASDLPPLAVRYILVIPHARARGRGRGSDADSGAARHAERLRSALTGLNITAELMDGPAVVGLLRERFAPTAAGARPSTETSSLRDDICGSTIDLADRRTIGIDSWHEQTIYVSRCPERTFYGWLLHAMQTQLPWTLSVHVRVRDRAAERDRLSRRAKRLWGVNEGAADRRVRPDRAQHDQETELEELVQELATGGQTLTDVAIYQTLRAPDKESLAEAVNAAARDLAGVVDADASLGDALQERLWTSSLPLGLDAARRTVPMISRNAADSVPFLSTSCGSADGIPLGIAEPGGTLERLNPFDRLHDNGTTLLFAKSGGGKTATAIALTSAALTRGCQINVLDRSAGHYAFLCDLIPGAVHLELGADDAATINPWDVGDPAAPPRSKVAYLVRLHALLIGDHEATHDSYGLGPLERNLLAVAIRATYRRAAEHGELPCESLLRTTLRDCAEREDPENAAVYRNLAHRLSEVCADGTYGYLFDRPTTVGAEDAPLIVFNTRRVPDDAAAPVLFSVLEFVSRRVERRYERHLRRLADGHAPAGPFDGTSSVVLEELWKLTERRATGTWVNELFRRARHIGLWPIAITQQRSDLATEHGRALLDNSTIQIYMRNGPDDIAHVAAAGRLSPEEVEQVSSLTTEKGSHAQAYVVNGERGRGAVTIRLGSRLYWVATSDPLVDLPWRALALQEAGFDAATTDAERSAAAFRALELLVDPQW